MTASKTDPEADDVTEMIIPLLAEHISVGKRGIVQGTVRVDIRTRTEEQIVDETLTQERVEVERVPVGRIVQAIPAIREEGDTTIISVVEEILVVERRLVLKEEIHLRRIRATERHQETVPLRRQEAEVTRTTTDEPVSAA